VCPEASDIFTKLSCYPTDVEEDDTDQEDKNGLLSTRKFPHHCQGEGAAGRLPALFEIVHFMPEQRI